MRRARLRARGHVQGVFFRSELRDRARSLGVAGWVRNVPDGSLEAALEGEGRQVESLLGWCRHGPAGARVDGLDVTWEEPVGEAGFSIR